MKESLDDSERSKSTLQKKVIAIRTFKLIAFIICITGFIIQARNFFNHFYSYPTVINTELTKPNNFTAPAITLCYTTQFKRSKYCKTYPGHCKAIKNITSFCENNSHYCRNNNTMIDPRIPKQKYLEYENYSKRNNTIHLCHDNSPFVNGSRGDRFFIQTRPKYGNTRFMTYPCFSRNIRLLNTLPPKNKKLEKINSISLYRLTVDAGQDEMFDPSARPGILFTLHSPFEPANPYVKGALMEPGRSYQIHMNLEEHHLLKDPYKTDCIDYITIWEANNKTGPRSREMCIDLCQMTFSLICRNCIWGISMYKTQHDICEMDNGTKCTNSKYKAIENRKRTDCMKRCKNECVKLNYRFTVEERTNIPTVDDEEGKGYIDVDIFLDDAEMLVLSHKPQYMDVEAFSYIGGFMGYWLGISIWAVADNIGSVFSYIVLYVKNCARRKTGKKEPTKEEI